MKLKLITCAAIVAAALPVAASASSTPLGSASAQLTDLSYRLVDLDPDDGIAPSITFTTGNQVRLFAEGGFSNSRETLGWLSNPFDAATALSTVAVDGEQAAIEGNSLSARSDIFIGDAVANNALLATGQHQASVASRGSLGTSPFTQGWTLSARTALVVEGRALATLNNDLTSLLPLVDKDIHSSSTASIGLSLEAERNPGLQASFSKFVFKNSRLDASGNIWTDASDPAALDETFVLTLSNEGATAMKGRLGFGVNAVTSLSVTTLTSPVPEPSQWALYLMGMAMLPLVARRRST